mgnify:CR=1 FL=1
MPGDLGRPTWSNASPPSSISGAFWVIMGSRGTKRVDVAAAVCEKPRQGLCNFYEDAVAEGSANPSRGPLPKAPRTLHEGLAEAPANLCGGPLPKAPRSLREGFAGDSADPLRRPSPRLLRTLCEGHCRGFCEGLYNSKLINKNNRRGFCEPHASAIAEGSAYPLRRPSPKAPRSLREGLAEASADPLRGPLPKTPRTLCEGLAEASAHPPGRPLPKT